MGEQNCDNFEMCYNTLKTKGVKNPSDSIELKDQLRECFEVMLNQQVDRPKFVEEQLQSLYQKINANGKHFFNFIINYNYTFIMFYDQCKIYKFF